MKIKDLKFDKDIYPRMAPNWQTSWIYAEQMKTGAVFPAINVGEFKNQLYIVDGVHRVKANQIRKETLIQAVIKKYADKKEMFIDAVKLNNHHGLKLSTYDKVRIIQKLEAFKLPRDEISRITMVALDKISLFDSRVATSPSGEKIFLKGLTVHAGITEGIDQNSMSSRTPKLLFQQLIALLGTDEFVITDDLLDVAEQTFSLLQVKLGKHQLKVKV